MTISSFDWLPNVLHMLFHFILINTPGRLSVSSTLFGCGSWSSGSFSDLLAPPPAAAKAQSLQVHVVWVHENSREPSKPLNYV